MMAVENPSGNSRKIKRSFLQKILTKTFNFFSCYISLGYILRQKCVRLHLKVKLHYAHISSLICLVFIDPLVKVPGAGYLGFQLVSITSVSLRCHLHKGIPLSSYTDILYQASLSPPLLSSGVSTGEGVGASL